MVTGMFIYNFKIQIMNNEQGILNFSYMQNDDVNLDWFL